MTRSRDWNAWVTSYRSSRRTSMGCTSAQAVKTSWICMAGAVLFVGSSLMAYSGYRFCERAHAAGKPIAAINRGRTRADRLFHLKVDADCGASLTALVGQLVC